MLKLDHISKSFDGVSVLNDISLEVQDGEIVSILGPSGCGKTTLLNLILGITDTDEGTIYYQEEDITKLSMEKRDFNIVFQDYALFPNLNVYQNIVYGLRNKPGLSTAEEVDALIDLLELRAHLDKKIEQLSGGQKQRAALAGVLALNPEILIFDEATSMLDPKGRREVLAKMKKLRDCGKTVVMITHDMHLMLEYTPRALVFADGRLIADDSAAAVLCNRKLVERAALKETSLFTLANRAGITPPEAFVECFIEEDREVRSHGR